MEKLHADQNGCYWEIRSKNGEWSAITDEYGGVMFSASDYGRLLERISDYAWCSNVHDEYDRLNDLLNNL